MKALGSSLVAILLAATGGTAYSQIYKWVDEAGKTHYSDQAPAGGEKPDTVADRISVYSPDPSLLARATAPAAPDPALSARAGWRGGCVPSGWRGSRASLPPFRRRPTSAAFRNGAWIATATAEPCRMPGLSRWSRSGTVVPCSCAPRSRDGARETSWAPASCPELSTARTPSPRETF